MPDGTKGHFDGVKIRLDNGRVIKVTPEETEGILTSILTWKVVSSRKRIEGLKAMGQTFIAHSMVWGRSQETHHETFEQALEFLKIGEDMGELTAERIAHPDGTVTTREQLAELI